MSLSIPALALTFPLLAADPAYLSTQDELLQRADRLEQSGQFVPAIAIYESLIDAGAGRDLRWTAYVLFRMACAQYQAGDRVGALESTGVAVTLDPEEPAYKAFQADVRAETTGTRRSTVYRPRRDQGSARRLVSTNGVLHIFVRGRNTDPWDPDEESKIRHRIEESDGWLQERAAESGRTLHPVFEHRYLTVLDEPFWRKIDVPDPDSALEYRRAWLAAIPPRFQADTYAELFDRVFGGVDFDNRGVVIHVARRRDAFAPPTPYQKEPADLECAFVRSERSEWDNPYEAVLYTHELLHLYGADDLYSKVPDPAVPESDVMNFGAHRIDLCLLSSLTRYAIGWTDQPPRLKNLRLATAASKLKTKKGARG